MVEDTEKTVEQESVETPDPAADVQTEETETQTEAETGATGSEESGGEESLETQEEEAVETSGEQDSKTRKLFEKKKDKAKAKLEERVAELEEKRVRQLAEFENFRKRSEKEKSQMFEMGARDVIEKFLPVIDNFERGLTAVPEEQKEDSFVQGMELVYKQMMTALEELSVTPIEAVGQEFDPNLHNAVMAVDDENLESGTVAEELQKGYRYKDSVVRHSMVKVVN